MAGQLVEGGAASRQLWPDPALSTAFGFAR